MITIRRVYDPEEPGEKHRVLVDRLWPRGVSKENAGWNEWMREVSPWFSVLSVVKKIDNAFYYKTHRLSIKTCLIKISAPSDCICIRPL